MPLLGFSLLVTTNSAPGSLKGAPTCFLAPPSSVTLH